MMSDVVCGASSPLLMRCLEAFMLACAIALAYLWLWPWMKEKIDKWDAKRKKKGLRNDE